LLGRAIEEIASDQPVHRGISYTQHFRQSRTKRVPVNAQAFGGGEAVFDDGAANCIIMLEQHGRGKRLLHLMQR